jgi:hypothetical protein
LQIIANHCKSLQIIANHCKSLQIIATVVFLLFVSCQSSHHEIEPESRKIIEPQILSSHHTNDNVSVVNGRLVFRDTATFLRTIHYISQLSDIEADD